MQLTKPSSPRNNQEFNFTSTSTSPYVTAPSSPQRFGNYIFTTAPTTPSRAAPDGITPSTIPFHWEEKPGTPKSVSSHYDTDVDEDFAFDFSGYLETPSLLPADELFSGGKIKPLKLKLPPRLNNLETNLNLESPNSKSPREKIKEALTLTLSFSPRKKSGNDFDPFAAAMEETRRPEKIPAANWYKKWKLKNLLLFRSASEGHKEKYELLKKSGKNKDSKNWSFRSVDNDGGGSVGSRKMSAHEWHYTVNRSVAEEMRKKTYLPYKQGFFGCLGFRVSGVHEISNRGMVSAMGRE